MDSTPLVCVTGQVRSHLIGTDAFQECDIVGLTTPIVKHSWLVKDVEEIPHVMKAAFHIARTGRCGPVLVDIPRDIQEAEIDFRYPDEVDLPGWRPPTRGHPRQIAEAARRIAAAERPVLYVGGGTLNADACAELLELAEAARAPVITTLMAKGAFPETHELHFGWPGMHGPKWSNLAMNTCDLLVAVGSRFDDRVTGKLTAFAPGATRRPPRHRRRGDLEAPPRRRAGRRPAEAGARRPRRRSCSTLARPPTPSRGCARSRRGARSSRSATATAATRSSRRRCSRRSAT